MVDVPGHCATCRWWAVGYPDADTVGAVPPGWGSCLLMENEESVRDPTPVHAHDPEVAHRRAYATDGGNGGPAWCYVAPDFGCVQWEAP